MHTTTTKNQKHRCHVRILFLILSLTIVLITITRYQHHFRNHWGQGIALADQASLEDKDYYILKEGYYCGEGGYCTSCHANGFIYYTAPMQERTALEKAGFEYIPAESEYCKGADWARIVGSRKYHNGFLLYYEITGEA